MNSAFEVLAVEEIHRHLAHASSTVQLALQNTQKSMESSKHGYLSLYFEPGSYLVMYHDHRHTNKVFNSTCPPGLLEPAYLIYHRVAKIAAFVEQAIIAMDCANEY